LQLIPNFDPSVLVFNFNFQCGESPLNHGCRVSVLSLSHVCIFIQKCQLKWRLLDCPPLAIDSNVFAHPLFDEHYCLPLLEHLMLQGLLGLNHPLLIGLVKHLELDILEKVKIFPNCVSRLWTWRQRRSSGFLKGLKYLLFSILLELVSFSELRLNNR
jgi:hypothetical protein